MGVRLCLPATRKSNMLKMKSRSSIETASSSSKRSSLQSNDRDFNKRTSMDEYVPGERGKLDFLNMEPKKIRGQDNQSLSSDSSEDSSVLVREAMMQSQIENKLKEYLLGAPWIAQTSPIHQLRASLSQKNINQKVRKSLPTSQLPFFSKASLKAENNRKLHLPPLNPKSSASQKSKAKSYVKSFSFQQAERKKNLGLRHNVTLEPSKQIAQQSVQESIDLGTPVKKALRKNSSQSATKNALLLQKKLSRESNSSFLSSTPRFMRLHSQEMNGAINSFQSSFFNYSINQNSLSVVKIDPYPITFGDVAKRPSKAEPAEQRGSGLWNKATQQYLNDYQQKKTDGNLSAIQEIFQSGGSLFGSTDNLTLKKAKDSSFLSESPQKVRRWSLNSRKDPLTKRSLDIDEEIKEQSLELISSANRKSLQEQIPRLIPEKNKPKRKFFFDNRGANFLIRKRTASNRRIIMFNTGQTPDDVSQSESSKLLSDTLLTPETVRRGSIKSPSGFIGLDMLSPINTLGQNQQSPSGQNFYSNMERALLNKQKKSSVDDKGKSPAKRPRKISEEVEASTLLKNQTHLITSKSLKLSNSQESKDYLKPPKVPKHLRSDKISSNAPPKPKSPSYLARQRYTIDKYAIVNSLKEDMKRNKRIIFQRAVNKEENQQKLLAMKHIYSVLLPKQQEERQAIMGQIQAIKSLKHANLVQTFDFIEDTQKRCFHIVMENMEGGSLESLLASKQKSTLGKRMVQQYFRSLIFGLEYCHSQNPPLIHGNIKPSNLLLNSNQTDVKLSDFGMQLVVEKTSTEIVTNVESNYFMAPELISAADTYSEATDLWACGVTLFLMVTGSYPFKGGSLPQLYQCILTEEQVEIICRPEYPSDMNAILKSLLTQLLCKDPAKRIKLADVQSHDWFTSNGVLSPIPSCI